MGRTTDLRRALKTRFFPYALDRGFVADGRRQPVSTTFRRLAGSSVQIFDVQWEKYGKPRFAVHFGTCPAGGLSVSGTLHPPGEALPTWCPDTGSLQPRDGTSTRSWFRQDATLLQRLLGRPPLRDPAEVAEEVVALFPELERYWQTGEVGRHMRRWFLD